MLFKDALKNALEEQGMSVRAASRLTGVPGGDIKAYLEGVLKTICDYSAKQLQELYQALQKEYGQDAGSAIYRQIKPQIRNLYKKIPK